jgi:hypothetical protein
MQGRRRCRWIAGVGADTVSLLEGALENWRRREMREGGE